MAGSVRPPVPLPVILAAANGDEMEPCRWQDY